MRPILFLEFDFPFLSSPPIPSHPLPCCCRFKVHRHVSVCVKLMCRATVRWPSCECWEEGRGRGEGGGEKEGDGKGGEEGRERLEC